MLPFLAILLSILPSRAVQPLVFETEPRDTVLVRLDQVIPDLLTDVRYATTNNFTGRVLYATPTLMARRIMAERLRTAEQHARKLGFRLKIYDAYRPLSVQRVMWSIVPDERYVADPAKGSRHNRGCAVDLTLCKPDGTEIDMGTGYDEFTELASFSHPSISTEVAANRRLLQSIMNDAGFDVLPSEWWHYDMRGWEAFAILDE